MTQIRQIKHIRAFAKDVHHIAGRYRRSEKDDEVQPHQFHYDGGKNKKQLPRFAGVRRQKSPQKTANQKRTADIGNIFPGNPTNQNIRNCGNSGNRRGKNKMSAGCFRINKTPSSG